VSGQPLNSFNPASGQASSLSATPSPSVSFPPNLKVNLQYVENELVIRIPEGSLYLQIFVDVRRNQLTVSKPKVKPAPGFTVQKR
jgi:hypothetical protein